MQDIYEEIKNERIAQDKKWGGAKHDDKHCAFDWRFFILDHAHAAIHNFSDFRKQMIKVAALAIAAIEWWDRNNKND